MVEPKDIDDCESSEDDENYVPQEEEEVNEDDENESDDNFREEDNKDGNLVEQHYIREDDEKRKKRIDDLFSEFLADTEPTTSTPSGAPESSTLSSTAQMKNELTKSSSTSVLDTPPSSGVSDEFFSFPSSSTSRANIQSEVCQTRLPKSSSQSSLPNRKRTSNCLSHTVNVLSKRSRKSVLDKSADDWTTFKAEKGIEDELLTFNRGKAGYLEKIAFLDRSDLRQFENEKSARNFARRKL